MYARSGVQTPTKKNNDITFKRKKKEQIKKQQNTPTRHRQKFPIKKMQTKKPTQTNTTVIKYNLGSTNPLK